MKPKTQAVLNSIWTFIAAVLVVGPFALPLLWRNPKYSHATKIFWSAIVFVFTGLLVWGSAEMTERMLATLQP